MSEAEARRIVEEAAKKGEISQDQATEVLASPQKGSFWKKLTGK
jgi:polyhydroxyalkanoate synthesis regulator phasin